MNVWMGVGRATKDCEITTTANGVNVAKFTIAVDRRFKDADGNKVTDFVNIVAWRGLADICGNYVKKGSLLAVQGEMQIRNYEAQDGTKRYITEIIADNVKLLGSNKSETENTQNAEPDKKGGSLLSQIDDDNLPF